MTRTCAPRTLYRFLIGLLAVYITCGVAPVFAQGADAEVVARIESWYRRAQRRAPGLWGIAIADQQGHLVWSLHPDEPLIPASTVKLFTTGFARSTLGGDARRPTRVLGQGGTDSTGTWFGTWALELNGDMSLERASRQGPQLSDLAIQLRNAGIRRLTGPLVVQSSEGPAESSYPSVWSTRHRGRLFAPPIGAITLSENVVRFSVKPGTRQGARPVIVGESPRGVGSLVEIRAKTVAGRRSKLWVQATAEGGWIVGGTIGRSSRGRTFSAVANNPTAVLRAAWGAALRGAGIEWDQATIVLAGPGPSRYSVLAEVESPPLDSLASEVNRRSLNIGAELLLRWAGGTRDAASRLVEHVLAVTGKTDGVHLVDGSGLSNLDRVAPSTFTAYLARFPLTKAGRNFPQLLPANGQGTLGRLASGFPGRGVVRAKTGTLNDVSTVVGYLGRQDGVLLVSLMYNGGRPHTARSEQWRLFRALGGDGVVIPSEQVDEVEEVQLGGESSEPAPAGAE